MTEQLAAISRHTEELYNETMRRFDVLEDKIDWLISFGIHGAPHSNPPLPRAPSTKQRPAP